MEEKNTANILTEDQILDILANAICDVGYWSWWASSLPTGMQIEFGGTQLYFPPTDNNEPPNTQIAIQFINPKSISFLNREEINELVESNWYDELHDDKMEPPTCSYGCFTFTDTNLMSEIFSEAQTINTFYGHSSTDIDFLAHKCKLVFWAGDYGFAIASEEMRFHTREREVKLSEIPLIHSQWWAYWKKYHDLRGTKNSLPEDYACEVTIPLKD